MEKKGFTLVELLAVIVILAVILIIAMPQIMNTIKTSRLKTMEGSAKLILKRAEKEYIAKNMGKTNLGYEVINCDEIVKISKDEYSRCRVEVSPEGEAYINLKGTATGKFKGMTCIGTIDNMDCRQGLTDSESIYALGIPQITNLTYNINYDKCMEMAELNFDEEDREPYCTDQVAPAGFSLREDLLHGETVLIDKGIVTNVNVEYEQITDYNSLNSNVFIKLPKGESRYDDLTPKSVCIKYQGNTSNEINCFEYDNYEYEKQHLADVFGKDKCTGNDVGSLALKDSFLNKVLGIENVYAVSAPAPVKSITATDGLYSCIVNEFGYVSCAYDDVGYMIDSRGWVGEKLQYAPNPFSPDPGGNAVK